MTKYNLTDEEAHIVESRRMAERMSSTEQCIQQLPEDLWAHRSERMRCRSCMFFVLKTETDPGSISGSVGRCRRRAPTMAGFPVVFEKDWCGDHKLKEHD